MHAQICILTLDHTQCTLQSAALQELRVRARVGRLSEHAARLRIAIPAHQSTALVAPASSKSKDADGGDIAAKVGVPLVYREATDSELNISRYISSKQHITDRHIDGGEFFGCDVLELAMTGEQVSADGKSTVRHCSPMMVQLA